MSVCCLLIYFVIVLLNITNSTPAHMETRLERSDGPKQRLSPARVSGAAPEAGALRDRKTRTIAHKGTPEAYTRHVLGRRAWRGLCSGVCIRHCTLSRVRIMCLCRLPPSPLRDPHSPPTLTPVAIPPQPPLPDPPAPLAHPEPSPRREPAQRHHRRSRMATSPGPPAQSHAHQRVHTVARGSGAARAPSK